MGCSVVTFKADTFDVVVERRTLSKLSSTVDKPDHALRLLLDRQRRSRSNGPFELSYHRTEAGKSFTASLNVTSKFTMRI